MTQILTVSQFMRDVAFIAGGAARYALYTFDKQFIGDTYETFNPKPGDIDLFLYNRADWDEAKEVLKNEGYHYHYTNGRGSETWGLGGEWLNIQLVTPDLNTGGKSGNPDDVIRSFGLTVEQFAIHRIPDDGTLLQFFYTNAASEDHVCKLIAPTGMIDPAYTLRRMLKYAAKGYRVADETIFTNLLDEWHKMESTERVEIRARVLAAQENY